MTYALVTDNTIQSIGRLPNSARRLDNGAWVMGLADATQELREATGWYEVVDANRPADTATTTYGRSVELVDGAPTVVWTERDKTPEELTGETRQANQTTINQAITDALAELRTMRDYASLPVAPAGTHTTEQLSNYIRALRDEAQTNRDGIQRVCETLIGTIRLVRGDFDSVD